MKRSWIVFYLALSITVFMSLAWGSLGASPQKARAVFYGQAQASEETPDADGEVFAGPAAEPTNNDNFDYPLVINTYPYANSQSVAEYSVVADDPEISCIEDTGFATAWYRYTPSQNQTLVIDTFGSNYDTALAVWTGVRGSLTSVICNDDFNEDTYQSLVTVNLTAGITYLIEVASYDYSPSGTSLTLNMDLPGPPEIVVKGNGVSIMNGDAVPTLTDHTDFDSAVVDGGTVMRTFTIENWGTGSLILDGVPHVSIGGVNAEDFTVTVQPASPIGAGGSTTFSIRFDPSAEGLRSAVISISNNDGDENPFTIAIQGVGTANPIENHPIYLPIIVH